MMFNDHLPIIVVAVVLGIAITWLYRDLQSLKGELKRGTPGYAAQDRPQRPRKVRFAEVQEVEEAEEEEEFDEMPDADEDP